MNALVFLYELAWGSDRTTFIYTFGLIPAELTTGANFTLLTTQQGPLDIATPWPAWTTLFTAMFMHGDIMHFGSKLSPQPRRSAPLANPPRDR